MSVFSDFEAMIGDVPCETNPKLVQTKSRDFYWYSPLLREKLEGVCASAIVSPRTEAEVRTVLAACWTLDLPVTPRGGGTGNYGQCMPLAGGIVLDMTRLNRVGQIAAGRVTVEPGALMGEIQAATLAHSRQELRMHPSTLETATIGGFLAGGSGGVGSLRWGMLREPGNVLAVKLATVEKEPRILCLRGAEIQNVLHSYGTNGVITEVEMALSPAQDWIELILGYENWMECVEAGWLAAHAEGLWLKQLGAIQAPAPFDYFNRHRKFLVQGDNVLCALAAPNAVAPLLALLEGSRFEVRYRSDLASEEARKGLPHLHHVLWNHTTFRAMKADPQMTYLQVGLPRSEPTGTLRTIAGEFEGEIIGHVEFTRSSGRVSASFLPLYRYSSEARLHEISHALEAMGCACYNPHVYTYEEGNHCGPDADRLALKRQADPKGLLNPGKMIGWDNPDYTYDPEGGYNYPGLQERAS